MANIHYGGRSIGMETSISIQILALLSVEYHPHGSKLNTPESVLMFVFLVGIALIMMALAAFHRD